MELIWMIWFLVLPVVALVLLGLIPVVWFFIIPKIARKLTWARFGDTNIAGIADSAGYFDLEVSRKSLGEGVLDVGKKIFRFLPRPLFKSAKKQPSTKESQAERVILRKYILKGLGKPIWLGWAGKVPVANPEAVAALQGEHTAIHNPSTNIEKIKQYVDEKIPAKFQKGLHKLLNEIGENIKPVIPVFNLDLDVLKEVLPKMNTTSQMKALANEYYLKGQASRDRDILKVGFVAMIILGMIVLAIILATQL